MKIISEHNTKENFYLNDSEIEYIPKFELIDDPYRERLIKKKLQMGKKDDSMKQRSQKKLTFI